MSDIYLSITETPTVVTLTNPLISSNVAQSVTVTNVVSVNVVTMPAINVTAAAPSVTTVVGTVAVSNFPASSSVTIGGFSTSSLPPSTVTVANSVTINGTVTANLSNTVTATWRGAIGSFNAVPIVFAQEGQAGGSAISYDGSNTSLNVNVKGSLPAISGTVTVGAIVGPAGGSCLKAISPSGDAVRSLLFTKDSAGTYGELSGSGQGIFNLPVYGTVTVGNSVTIGSLPAISGTVTANVFGNLNHSSGSYSGNVVPVQIIRTDDDVAGLAGAPLIVAFDSNSGSTTVTVSNSVTIGSLPAISGTVTANSIFPRVTLIDGSGTVATANTAITVFASSSTRSYLLVQVTTGSAFVNVGATATTVNGINLTAGQGYSWETTIPQGIVSLISTTTNSRYVAKEA